MNSKQMEQALLATLSEAPGDYTSGEALAIEDVRSVRTFEDLGVLSRDLGLVVSLNDGSEFQLTIVQTRTARD